MEQATQKKMNWMKLTMAMLLVAIGLQSYYMYQMKGSLETMKSEMHHQVMARAPEMNAAPSMPEPSVMTMSMPVMQVAMPTMMPDMDMMDPMPMSVFDEKWSPVAEMMHMRKQMDRMFEDAFGRLGERFPEEVAMDMESMFMEDGDDYVMSMPIPDMDSDNVEISVDEHNMMTVKGKLKQMREEQDDFGNMVAQQVGEGSFSHHMTLPGTVKPETMKSEYKDGKLMVRVAKR